MSQELVSLAFFDRRVSSSTKKLMVRAMQNEGSQGKDHSKRITIALDSFKDKDLEDFVTAQSMTLTRMLELPHGCSAVDPDLWEDRDDYKQAAETVESLKLSMTTLNVEWHSLRSTVD